MRAGLADGAGEPLRGLVTDRLRNAAFALALGIGGCNAAKGTDASVAPPSPAPESASAPVVVVPPAKDPTPSVSAVEAPVATATATAVASATAAPSASDTPDDRPIPKVKVANIGMHIGGGPNDAPTKEPIKKSVEPHFDELKRCFALAPDPSKGGDFGLDLRIKAEGGKAATSHVRSTIKSPELVRCVEDVFQKIDFLKPKKGATIVSYSLRFTP